ncbi:putative cell wall biosynthesis protein LcpB [Nocardioides aquaticus]|uniref:Cell wall biosynthesis protein LcpB n=1 Tax=Nocardioides aquaticus TaxID=160826 RepID=A0ABX8ENA8_9ACTN|nr:LCP family protein [Nocardioides aquaticus]QVT81607.1 putative cell wall biosynthesis protein LcpB [Nocardioides aquaticus]
MTEPTPESTHGRRRARTSRRHTVAKVLISSLVVVAMVTGLGVVFLYRHLNDNLTVLDPGSQLTDRPEKAVDEVPQEPLNILVMGSDTRAGEGNAIDNESGAGGSDTTLLFHLSADRENAYGISIPRDSIVDRPSCTTDDGDAIPAETDVMWNEAFTVGGPLCTVQQFEQLSGVFVDHFVVVDFNGFRDMVDAIGGVEVCIPEDIEDPAHGINIPAGTREISGYEALNYVRARYTLGDGSDIGRIKRQQAFIAAMANKVVSGGMLARPDQLVGFLDAATESLTVDPGLSNVLKIGRIGLGFSGIGLSNIRFSTVPFEYDTRPGFEGRVVWTPEAADVWDAIAADEPLSRRLEGETVISADSVPGTSSDESASPSDGTSAGPSGGASAPPQADPEREAQLEAAGLCA